MTSTAPTELKPEGLPRASSRTKAQAIDPSAPSGTPVPLASGQALKPSAAARKALPRRPDSDETLAELAPSASAHPNDEPPPSLEVVQLTLPAGYATDSGSAASPAPVEPAGEGSINAGPSLGARLLTPMTQVISWAPSSFFGAAPAGAAATGALLTVAALGAGSGGGGSSSTSTPSTPTDTTAPTLLKAAINNTGGSQLILNFSENLSPFLPAASAFQVLVDGSRVSVSSVVRGTDPKTVVLTLASPVTRPAAVLVSLSDGSQIRDIAGNVASTFRDQSVTVTDKTAPNLLALSAITNATESIIVLRYSEPLQSSARPDTGQFQVSVNGIPQNVKAVQIAGDSIRLSLESKITADNPTVRLSYTVPTDGTKAVQDAAGNRAAAIVTAGGTTVSHSLDSTAPTLEAGSGAVVAVDRSARQIRLTFTEALDPSSLPKVNDLTVNLIIGNSTRAVAVSDIKLSGSVMELTLAEAITDPSASLKVLYTPPASGALKDWAGNAVANFDRSISRADASAPTLSSSRFVSSTQLELTFSEDLSSQGPDLAAWSLTANGGATLKPISSSITGRTLTLTFATAVQTGKAASLSYTAPNADPSPLNRAVQDSAGNDSASFSRTLDTTAPKLLSAQTSANGLQITLKYDEALLGPGSSGTPVIPAISTNAFTVLKNGQQVAVSSVTISGDQVLLNLASALRPDERIQVFYSAPTASIGVNNAAIQDASGNDAASLGSGVDGQTVGNLALPAVSQVLLDSKNAALDRLVINLNVAASGPLPDKSAFTVKLGGATLAIDSVSGSGSELILQLAAPITTPGTLQLSYTKPGSNPLKDASGKEMASFTDQAYGQVITGTSGNDSLSASTTGQVEYFLGSKGTDSFLGRGGADHFVWPDFGSSGGPGGFTHTLFDFGFKRGTGSLQGLLDADTLDISQLLDGYTSTSAIASFIRAVKNVNNKLTLEIDHDGGSTFSTTATLVFDNVTINSSNQLTVNNGQFIDHNGANLTLSDVISHLISQGQLAVL